MPTPAEHPCTGCGHLLLRYRNGDEQFPWCQRFGHEPVRWCATHPRYDARKAKQ